MLVSSESIPFTDGSTGSGISPVSSPLGHKVTNLQFNLEGQKFTNELQLIDAMLEWIRVRKVQNELIIVNSDDRRWNNTFDFSLSIGLEATTYKLNHK